MRHRHGYRGYESAEKAKAALRRRCRGIARPELDDAFAHACALYDRAEAIARHPQPPATPTELQARLHREFPASTASAIQEAARWAHYWRVLR
jgi:hypothetical protein